MKVKRTPTLLLAMGLAIALGSAGCTTQNKTTEPAPTTATRPAQQSTVQRSSGWPTRSSGSTMNWSSMAYPTGPARTRAVGIEKGFPREVRLNAPFDYELAVTNLTSNTLEDVVVTDEPGQNLRMNSSSPGGRNMNGTMTRALGSLEPQETKTIRVNATATAEGTIATCAGITYSSMLCSTAPVVAPKLQLTKTGPAEVLKCDEIVYRIEVKNSGTGTLRNVKITDELPAGLTGQGGERTMTMNVGELKAGQSRPFSIRAKAARTGSFSNKATATGEGGLSVASNTVTTAVKQPVLTITKSCPPKQFIGRPIEYRITVRNTGDGVARDTVITDTIPRGAAFASASDGGRAQGGKVRWNAGTLAPNATKSVTLTVNPTDAGTYRNSVAASAYCADTVTATCQTEVTGIPAILLEVVDLEDPVQVGNTTTYVITVTNQGSAPGTNIRIVSTLESNQTHVSSRGATEGTARGNTVSFAPIPSLAAGDKAVFRVVVRNTKAGDVRFSVSMTSDQLTRPVSETEATNVYE